MAADIEIVNGKGQELSIDCEAPGHIPMEIQKTAYEELDAGKTLGISISSGYMYDPVKSSCQVFETTDNERVMHLTHGCASCSNTDCPYRTENVVVRVKDEKGDHELSAAKGTNLLGLLQENRIKINAICGGSSRCGKCAVKLLAGSLEITDSDKRFFSEEELAGGMRLACTACVFGDCTIETVHPFEDTMVSLGPEDRPDRNKYPGIRTGKTGIAIDIGTTTLALSITDMESGGILDTYTAINHQRSLGADVITRIEAAGKGKAAKLRELICDDLLQGIQTLIKDNQINPDALQMIAVAGNTTMLHLLMGYPTESLGGYPFTPYNTGLEERKLGEVLLSAKGLPVELKDIKTVLLPGNSAFVGADIVSGLYSCGFHENEKICALIDLGTNGEMAIGNKDRLMVTSTAAGPAFEGGNIKWGVGSVRGAIAGVHIENGTAEIKTIGDTHKAVGICGTGVIEAAAELLRNGLIDETGAMSEDYFDDGFPLAINEKGEEISFTQKDVREIQLAKSAVRAGFETMLKRYGADYEDIDKLYIAGGFGFYLNPAKAAAIGMIPEELLGRCVAAGNTSLAGAIKYLSSPDEAGAFLSAVAEMGEEITLSTDKDFNKFYMEYMMF